MSDVPELQILTLEELIAHSEKMVLVPLMSEQTGKPVGVRIRKIASREYGVFPGPPPEAVNWPSDEEGRREAERVWLLTLTEEQLDARKRAIAEAYCQMVACATVAPKLTVEQARALGDDAVAIAHEIEVFSGFVKPKVPPPNGHAG
jgi:hypothetical protein